MVVGGSREGVHSPRTLNLCEITMASFSVPLPGSFRDPAQSSKTGRVSREGNDGMTVRFLSRRSRPNGTRWMHSHADRLVIMERV